MKKEKKPFKVSFVFAGGIEMPAAEYGGELTAAQAERLNAAFSVVREHTDASDLPTETVNGG
ncbi:MAG: hypothetical protein LBL66_09300 [Clostridiales bacterium]|jgi:hypothetical protein|nr:hypothetical protein [Clostridiales bacterium]